MSFVESGKYQSEEIGAQEQAEMPQSYVVLPEEFKFKVVDVGQATG